MENKIKKISKKIKFTNHMHRHLTLIDQELTLKCPQLMYQIHLLRQRYLI